MSFRGRLLCTHVPACGNRPRNRHIRTHTNARRISAHDLHDREAPWSTGFSQRLQHEQTCRRRRRALFKRLHPAVTQSRVSWRSCWMGFAMRSREFVRSDPGAACRLVQLPRDRPLQRTHP